MLAYRWGLVYVNPRTGLEHPAMAMRFWRLSAALRWRNRLIAQMSPEAELTVEVRKAA